MKPKKTKITINSVENLEQLMQEIYCDANKQINDVNRAINELTNGADPEDVNDHALLAKEKGNLMKLKDSATKIKLDLAKLETDIIKHKSSNVGDDKPQDVDQSLSQDDFATIRELIKKKESIGGNKTVEYKI
jgi:hypothetical protein